MLKTILKSSALVLTFFIPTTTFADYPVGYQDHYVVRSGDSQRVEVLNNDRGNSLSVIESNDWTVKGGRTTFDSSDRDVNRRRLIYTAPTNFVGVDEFWYAMKIGASSIKHATKVTITVKENHFPGPYPVAKPDDVRVSGTSRGFNTVAYYPLDNDIGKNLKIVNRDGYSKEGGRYDVSSDGRLSYTPPLKFTNITVDSFDKIWYVIEDELGRKNWGVINLMIPAGYRG